MKNLYNFEEFINENYTDKSVKVGDIVDESDVYNYVQKLHRKEEDFVDGNLGERIENFSKYQVVIVNVQDICLDEYYLDDDDVQEYLSLYQKTLTYPPIVLGNFDARWGYDIIDGTHRANALVLAGLKSIVCFVGIP